MKLTHVGWDVETHLITPGNTFPRLVCVSFFYDDEDQQGVVMGREEGLKTFRKLLLDPHVLLVGQNTAYDVGIMVNEDPSLLPLVFEKYGEKFACTKIQETLIRIATNDPHIMRNTSLAHLVEKYLGENIFDSKKPDSWRLRYHLLDGVEPRRWPSDAYFYALDDAKYAVKVHKKQHSTPVLVDIPISQILANAPAQVEAAFALRLLNGWGICVDQSKVSEIKKSLSQVAEKADTIGWDLGILRENKTGKPSRNLTYLRELVTKAYDNDPPRTVKGNIQTSSSVLAESSCPKLRGFAQGDHARKLLSTFVPALEKGRTINANFNVLVRSGRTSCREPNLQNIPRKGIRDAFVPRSGMVFCGVDYDTIELRALAHVHLLWFGKSALADAFHDGIDPHLSLGATILGISYSEAVARRRDPIVEEMRSLGKLANFGYAGGLGPTAFVDYSKGYGVSVTLGQSTELRESWFRRWPEMRAYFKRVGRQTRKGEATVIQEGSGRVRGGCSFTVACNTQFQGLTACGAKSSLFNLYREIFSPDGPDCLKRVRPVIFLHDEIISEGPAESSHLWSQEVVRIMVEGMEKFIPSIPITAEAVLMERWYKKAKPVFDKKGRLVPWHP